MNYAIVFRLLGYVLMIEGALLLLPAAATPVVVKPDMLSKKQEAKSGKLP